MKYLSLFIISSVYLFSCTKKNNSRILTINISKDSCYVLLDSAGKPITAFRGMKILENSLSDTIGIGFGIISPGYIGKIGYYRVDTSVDKCFDPKYGTEKLPKTPMICVDLYLKRNFKGEIKLEYEY